MSYRRSYTGYVHYSGTVSYPASQTGGTKSYSGSEPVYITIDVDTNAFDASVLNCNNAVNGLTTAVVATEAAQVESKRRASAKIAASIVKGFFDYVGADLSQKIKELLSKCEALFVSLMGHKENCLARSKQMQDDYNRISKRYAKIFEDLDKETETRIEMLDRPTFQFADSAQGVIDKNVNSNLLGLSTVSANENITLETVLSCSHVKQQASTLIAKANDYLQGTYRLANTVKYMMDNGSSQEDILLPVLYTETVCADNKTESNLYGTDAKFGPTTKDAGDQILSSFLSKDIQWDDIESSEFEKVVSYMNTAIHSDNLEDRTLRTMLGLINNQSIKIIKA